MSAAEMIHCGSEAVEGQRVHVVVAQLPNDLDGFNVLPLVLWLRIEPHRMREGLRVLEDRAQRAERKIENLDAEQAERNRPLI